MEYQEQAMVLLRVLAAMGFGAIIGIEREMIGKPTGMRTHMLIAGASALFTTLGNVIVTHYGNVTCVGLVRSDPIRIIQAIVLGISFIGAGTIMQQRDRKRVIYLTSAASTLFTAGIGIATALDQYVLAGGCVAAVWFVNRGLRYFDKKFIKGRTPLRRESETDPHE